MTIFSCFFGISPMHINGVIAEKEGITDLGRGCNQNMREVAKRVQLRNHMWINLILGLKDFVLN